MSATMFPSPARPLGGPSQPLALAFSVIGNVGLTVNLLLTP